MFTKISYITLFVNNQDEALEFYTKKLGFQVHTDQEYSCGDFRWLTLNLPEQSDLELVLMPASTKEEKALVGKQGAKNFFLSLESTNCYRDYENLKNVGVEFAAIPEDKPWGISAIFKDLYGNQIYICQFNQKNF